MRYFGLIGKSLEYSYSPSYFKEKFLKEDINDTLYNLYPLKSVAEINRLIDDFSELSGLNVTIPYKESVIPYLDKLDQSAKEIGAVNTIKFDLINSNLKLTGYNTDYLGFLDSLRPILEKKHNKALILGTGGSSKAIAYALKFLNIDYRFVSRNPNDKDILDYESLNDKIIKENLLVINTTPLGMYPNEELCPPIPYQFLTIDHILYDLIYNPKLTKFLKLGQEKGSAIKNGLEMLQIQAEYSWKIWNNILY